MKKNSKIYVAGANGLVGSALVRKLKEYGYVNLITRAHKDLDLMCSTKTLNFFEQEKPEYVFLAAAKVGGIYANSNYPYDFIFNNITIQNNVINAAFKNNVKRLIFLGSSCIYPKFAIQPIKEESLLSGPLEETNRAYAIAKIAGIELCSSLNRQYNTKYLSVMPTNVYGPGDNFDLNNGHVIPALIRKFHEAKISKSDSVIVWGTGSPFREFIFSYDLADACIFLINLDDLYFEKLILDPISGPIINIGVGYDLTIKELAEEVSKVIKYEGKIVFDENKPDGTPKKLLDISKLTSLGWRADTHLKDGLRIAYHMFLKNTNG